MSRDVDAVPADTRDGLEPTNVEIGKVCAIALVEIVVALEGPGARGGDDWLEESGRVGVGAETQTMARGAEGVEECL